MGKFILSEIKDRIAQKGGSFIEERKQGVFAQSAFTLQQQYKLFFWGMKGYIEGKPNRKERLVWTALIENVVDSESTCDDPGFEGMLIKDRCHLIGKEKIVSDVNKVWIEKELKPYFEDSMRKQLTNVSEVLFGEIIKGEITPEESKRAYETYSNNPGTFKGALK